MFKRTLIVFAAAVLVFTGSIAIAGDVPPQVKAVVPDLQEHANEAVIVNAVKAANQKQLSQGEIKSQDDEWKASTGVTEFQKQFLSNQTANRLKEIQTMAGHEHAAGVFAEIFVMNNQGLIVGMSNKTSDYWQGDEAKFTESFAGGKGAVHFGDVEFDDSAQVYLIQVSVPVMDGGAAIGAVTFGVNMDAL